MRDIVQPGLVLLLITAVAAALLGFVYDITKEPIAFQMVEATASSMRALMPAADEFKEEIQAPEGSPVSNVSTAYAGGEAIGYVIAVAPKGYSGSIDMLVGVSPDGILEGITIVSQTETPGLGTNCEKEVFRNQYKGKSGVLAVTKSGAPGDNEIQAMTSATITTNAVTLGVNQALEFFNSDINK